MEEKQNAISAGYLVSQDSVLISSPEPKAHGELIVYQLSQRPSVRACVRPHF